MGNPHQLPFFWMRGRSKPALYKGLGDRDEDDDQGDDTVVFREEQRARIIQYNEYIRRKHPPFPGISRRVKRISRWF